MPGSAIDGQRGGVVKPSRHMHVQVTRGNEIVCLNLYEEGDNEDIGISMTCVWKALSG